MQSIYADKQRLDFYILILTQVIFVKNRGGLLWLCSVLGDPTLVVHRLQVLLQMLHSMSETQIPHVHLTPAYLDSYL